MAGERIARLSIAVHSGEFDRVHYALVMAAAAAATGTPVTLFFTQWATRALRAPRPDGAPGWHGMRTGEPGTTSEALDRAFAADGIVGFEELLESCTALGVRFIVCETGLIGAGVESGALRGDLPIEIAGAVTFLQDMSPDGASLFV